jgi:hypothetical protein
MPSAVFVTENIYSWNSRNVPLFTFVNAFKDRPSSNYEDNYSNLPSGTAFIWPEFNSGELYFGKSVRLPLCLSRFISIYGHCLSDARSNDISPIFGELLWIKTKASRSRVAAKFERTPPIGGVLVSRPL